MIRFVTIAVLYPLHIHASRTDPVHFGLDGQVPIWYERGMESVHPLTAFRKNQEPPLSQGDLAVLLGVARETVTRWESGARKINELTLPVVAKKTGIPKRELRPDLAEVMREAAE